MPAFRNCLFISSCCIWIFPCTVAATFDIRFHRGLFSPRQVLFKSCQKTIPKSNVSSSLTSLPHLQFKGDKLAWGSKERSEGNRDFWHWHLAVAVSGKREACLRFSLFLQMPSHFRILNFWLSHHFPSCHFEILDCFKKVSFYNHFNHKFFTSLTTGEALVQWYVVLVSFTFTLKSWQSWSLKRQAKKRRQVRVIFVDNSQRLEVFWKV